MGLHFLYALKLVLFHEDEEYKMFTNLNYTVMSKKSFLLTMLTTMMVAMMSVGYTSCSGDEEIIKPDPPITLITGVVDYDMYKKSSFDDFSPAFKIHINENNCFECGQSDYNGYMGVVSVFFMSVGPVKDISEIKMVPDYEQGWTGNTATVNSGYGYLVENRAANFLNRFMRIYVRDYIKDNYGSIIGAKIQYQLLSSQKIYVDETSFTFTAEGGSKEIKLPYPASYKVVGCPSWCSVPEDVNTIKISVSKNLTPKENSCQIVLKNNANEITFSIKQEGSSSPLFEGGNGTEENPYQISNAQQLQNINTKSKVLENDYYPYYQSHFSLISDIDLSSYLNNSENGWNPIGTFTNPFRGTIDGQNHTISGMWINQPNTNYIGLFGYAVAATIDNIDLKTSSKGFIGNSGVGGICGHFSGKISGCSVDGVLSGYDYVGGICGYVDSYTEYVQTMPGYQSSYKTNSTITNCVTKGIIKSSGSNRGEIIGGNLDSSHKCYPVNCSSTATLQDR